VELSTVGIDLGKTVFHLAGLNQRGEVVVRKKFSRAQLLQFTANLHVERIGMEACAGAHFLGRALREQGHDVRLMPAQYVKPYVKTNKSDSIDAEAIAEAVARPAMRFVPIKTDEQLDMQSLHRVRERWVMRRTAVVNQIRALLLERGITLRQGRQHLSKALPKIMGDATWQLSGTLRLLLAQLKLELDQLNGRIDQAGTQHLSKALPKIMGDATWQLSGTLRLLLAQLKLELDQLNGRIDQAGTVIAQAVQQNEACNRLVAIPGIGPVTATAMVAAIGNGTAFRKGREFAAWMGVVPRQYSTGGKQKLLGISKRGNSYLRKLFVQGARSVMLRSTKQASGLRAWLEQLSARTHHNVAIVALANKLARIAWAVLAKNQPYRPWVQISS
jgi:transposase